MDFPKCLFFSVKNNWNQFIEVGNLWMWLLRPWICWPFWPNTFYTHGSLRLYVEHHCVRRCLDKRYDFNIIPHPGPVTILLLHPTHLPFFFLQPGFFYSSTSICDNINPCRSQFSLHFHPILTNFRHSSRGPTPSSRTETGSRHGVQALTSAERTPGGGPPGWILWVLVDMGVSENEVTPKWMVYKGKSHENRWFRGTPISGNLHMTIVDGVHKLTYH